MTISSLLRELADEIASRFDVPLNGALPAAKQDSIAAQEHCFGGLVAQDYLEFLKLQDGEDYRGTSFIFGTNSGWISPVSFVLKDFAYHLNASAKAQSLGERGPGRGYYIATGPVHPYGWDEKWIPIMSRSSRWIIDMNPARGGCFGQIVVQSPENGENKVVCSSFADLLERQLDGVRKGLRSIEQSLNLKWAEKGTEELFV